MLAAATVAARAAAAAQVAPAEAGDKQQQQQQQLTAASMFGRMRRRLEEGGAGESFVEKVGAVFRFKIYSERAPSSAAAASAAPPVALVGMWVVDLRRGQGSVVAGDLRSKVDATIEAAERDFLRVCTGKLPPHEAVMQGLLKVRGDIHLAERLNPLLRTLGPRSRL